MIGCSSAQTGEQPMGWRSLMDPAAWRGYMKQDLPSGWQFSGGVLTRVAQAGDIVTREIFRNFEIELEWNIAEGGNSGVFFHGIEGPSAIYLSAPEMQILDDARHSDGQKPETSAGSNFAMHPVPRGIVKPAGEWNRAKLLVNGNHVEHWLNGTKVVEYELHSDDWKKRVAASKFAQWKEYGMSPQGHIALQDHGDRVAFRNIRIRSLPN
jgi:hypothetical protein